ncbi:MAG: extracellular solute-binding protein [Acetobacteraceae bacterium]|nr:extracellular solute-binding protein [Acetobacteraceae bacterium]
MLRALVVLLALLAVPAAAQTRSHALTILGTPSLPADFPYFPYINPQAPKGGEITFAMVGSFDGFNPYILRGNAAIGLGASWQPGVGGTSSGTAGGHVWESLLIPSADEVATAYGHLAETIELAPDRMWVAFELRPEARFADGSPVTAQDVKWTFDTLMEKGRPSFRVAFQDVKDAVAESPRRVVFHFKSNQNRELPLMVGGLPVLPMKWWATRDFSKPLTEPPLGSGPYKVGSFELGRSVTYVRDPNWWARDRPTGRGFANIDTVRIEYFRDPTVAFQAFKAGQIDYRQENISKQWATGYDFPAVTNGLVQKVEIPHELPIGIQGWLFNTRRAQFADRRVREALGQVFDFQWMNKNLFFGAYDRTTSYFGNTAQESKGLPSVAERALLDPFKDSIPPEIFSQPFTLAVTDGSGNNREGLKRALTLLEQAGWRVRDRKLVDASGKQMAFTILLNDPTLERIALPYQQWMQRLGIDVSVRTVDTAQFERLTDDYDFDMTTMIYPGSELPGNELRDEFSCEGGKITGGSNLAGICDKAVDAMVQRAVDATDRESLATAGRALDRLLLTGWYMVPNWHDSKFKIATWNRFGRPDVRIRDGFVLDSWWIEPALAAKTDAARRAGN